MIELGQLGVVLAWVLATLTAIGGLGHRVRGLSGLAPAVGSMVAGQFVFVLLGFALLVQAFLQDNFSVAYVAQHSNSALPWFYKFSATWGGHEGSFLLWVLIMCLWMLAVALRSGHLPRSFRLDVLGVMALMNLGFLSFLIFTSNPFERLVPFTPEDGADLNPLLQDFGLIVHPPMLYVGYVGFSVAFAFAIAALISGRLDASWARWSRPWTNTAWAFLTIGIALGSWWAYYELGWGGWWFWDPVENASFMPWLIGTALIHSLAATEKRGVFKSWTLLLAIAAFSLSLLGAFIVRSGVLTSVHAFAVDPERGVFILIFLLLVVGGSLALYAFRAWQLQGRARFSFFSRDLFLLVNNVLFAVALAAVLIGTLAPLAYEALTGGDKLSVGKPYFDQFFVPLMLLLAAFLAVVPALNWKTTDAKRMRDRLTAPLVIGVVCGFLLPLVLLDGLSLIAASALGLALWLVLSHVLDLVLRWRRRRPGWSYAGMWVAHVGFAISMVGVAITVELSVERDLAMAPGQTVEQSGVSFTFEGIRLVEGPNYVAQQGQFAVVAGDEVYQLRPEKRRYNAGGNIMTEAAIDPGLFRDVYISLGDELDEGAWAVRLHIKPLVRWIWLGALLMAFGGLAALLDRRYRAKRTATDAVGGKAAAA